MTEDTKQKSSNYKFKAEVSQLLDILTHSLYTHRDVFIRELVSNAADALDKVRFKEVKSESIADPDLNLEIRIDLDKDKKTFTISDTGIGMTKDELVKNIGTIARSGTSDFLKQLSEESKSDINLIGKFGVGFYSVFMAGKTVEVTSRSADQNELPYTWISDGKGSFKVEEAPEKIKRGTTIRVYLRDDAEEFAEKFNVQTVIEKYSNFVPFPIYLNGDKINKISAIWREPKSTVKKKDYNEFFKFIAHQNEDALAWHHFSADVPLQFHALLFVPKSNMELLGFRLEDEGINLFVKRVMVDAHAKDMLPPYLRFVRGVIESDDLPLNISRETLQENPYVIKIRNTVIGKFLTFLDEISQNKAEEYETLWKQHGRILKEGYTDFTHKDKLIELFRFNSSKCNTVDELISLQTYIKRMHKKQSEIYFLSGPSRESVENNPNLEIFKAKDIEVLYCYDPIDEFVLPGLINYKEKNIVSADQIDITKLSDIPSKDEPKAELKTDIKDKDMENLARRIKDILGKKVETVKLSERLVDSPAILVGKDKMMSAQMERIMQIINKETKPIPKILEINQKHPTILNMVRIYKNNPRDELLTKVVHNLFHSVCLLDGLIEDPHEMASGLQDLILDTTQRYLAEENGITGNEQKTKPTAKTRSKPK